jgi:hypothetical protein
MDRKEVWAVKRLFFFIVLLVAAPVAHAEIFTRVCRADGNTPLELADPGIPFVYRPIMVGTHLTIIISSDTNEEWNGGVLTLWDANLDYGVLPGGSSLPAAGPNAVIYPWIQSSEEHYAEGFAFGGGRNPSIGDWFIVDYNAISTGNCSVLFYDWDVDFDNPLYEMFFTHVRTRDFNGDGIVNFEDFAVLGLNWQRTDCLEPDNCSGTDLDTEGNVDISDLMQFAEYSLEKTR